MLKLKHKGENKIIKKKIQVKMGKKKKERNGAMQISERSNSYVDPQLSINYLTNPVKFAFFASSILFLTTKNEIDYYLHSNHFIT